MFDRTAECRVIEILTMLDDAKHQAVAITPEQAVGERIPTRNLERLSLLRELPKEIAND